MLLVLRPRILLLVDHILKYILHLSLSLWEKTKSKTKSKTKKQQKQQLGLYSTQWHFSSCNRRLKFFLLSHEKPLAKEMKHKQLFSYLPLTQCWFIVWWTKISSETKIATCLRYILHLEITTFNLHYLWLFFFFFFFCPFRATPVAYGGSQARSLIGAVAAVLCQSHSNTSSEPSLRPTP